MPGLTPKQAEFVKAFLSNGGNAYSAAKSAGYAHPKQEGSRLLENATVRAAVAPIMAEAVLADADRVVREWSHIATADARELIEYRRGACRFCWGEGHRYQRTPAERERDHGEHQQAEMVAAAKGTKTWKAFPKFDELGGVGYNPNREPHPDCPECFSEGVGRAIVRDTRTLGPEAASLYAGVKVTNAGLELKLHDKATALAALAKFHKLAGHTGAAGDGDAPQVHLHLHLVKALEGLSPAEREAARPLLARLAGSGKAEPG